MVRPSFGGYYGLCIVRIVVLACRLPILMIDCLRICSICRIVLGSFLSFLLRDELPLVSPRIRLCCLYFRDGHVLLLRWLVNRLLHQCGFRFLIR